ncbi:MAG: alpha-amylase family glycosyl hydrolase [Mycobacteriales bacterium]
MTDGEWWKTGTIYQIYPRSFADSDGDGVGDLAGITSKLDYLASLPVDAIWLSPFYPSPMADFGYDVADYCDVHPLFGTLADFDALTAGAHERGMKMIIDWVPCHCSDQHPWFLDAKANRDSPHRDWFLWRDPAPGGGPPNNWLSCFDAVGPAWTLDEASGQYYLHSFLPEQPDLNWENPELRAAMHETLRFWMDRGVDGFRIDVTHRLGKDPLLRDNPPGVVADARQALAQGMRPDAVDAGARMDENWPSTHDRLREIRAVADEYAARVLIGEVYLLDQRELVQYVGTTDELHLAHNFRFVLQPWSAAAFRDVVDEWHALANPAAWPDWLLENHDHNRVASRYGVDDFGDLRARLALMMVLTLRGTPFLFQGQELALPDGVVPASRIVDVAGRDPERCPIPWQPPSRVGAGAGFSTGAPWLPIIAGAEQLNAQTQDGDPRSALWLTRRLLGLRRDFASLTLGDYRSVDAGADVFAFERAASGDRIVVVLNFAATATSFDMAKTGGDSGQLLLSTVPQRGTGEVAGTVELGPLEGVVIRL